MVSGIGQGRMAEACFSIRVPQWLLLRLPGLSHWDPTILHLYDLNHGLTRQHRLLDSHTNHFNLITQWPMFGAGHFVARHRGSAVRLAQFLIMHKAR